jgi:hypothetical protein
MEPLNEGDHGPYGTLAPRPLPDGLTILLVPALLALLTRAEQLKGSPLTEEQVLRIRDVAVVVTRADAAAARSSSRATPRWTPRTPGRAGRQSAGSSSLVTSGCTDHPLSPYADFPHGARRGPTNTTRGRDRPARLRNRPGLTVPTVSVWSSNCWPRGGSRTSRAGGSSSRRT